MRAGKLLAVVAGCLCLVLAAACDRRGREAETLADAGLAAGRAGDLTQALRSFDEALQKDPANLKALYNSGIALLAAGRGEEAEERFRRFLKLRPEDALAHLQLARAVLRSGGHREAMELLGRAVELGLDDHAAWLAATDLQLLSHDLRFHQYEAVVAQRAGTPVGELRPGEGYAGQRLTGTAAPGVSPAITCE